MPQIQTERMERMERMERILQQWQEIKEEMSLWKRLQKIERLTVGMPEHPIFVCKLHEKTKQLSEKIKSSIFWEFINFDDPTTNDYLICSIIGRLICQLPFDRIPFLPRKKLFQLCGVGANPQVKRNYRATTKKYLLNFISVSTFPIRYPVRNKWGKLMRREYKKLELRGKGKDRSHRVRLALLNVGRKFLVELKRWMLSSDNLYTSYGQKCMSPDIHFALGEIAS